MKVKQQKSVGAVIPTASMADIAFLLIIFFMVTTTHQVDKTTVTLPEAVVYSEAEKGAAYVVLHRDINTGEFEYKFSDGESPSKLVSGPKDIYLEASAVAYKDDTRQFALKADGDLKFFMIDELMDQLRKAGVKNVLLLIQPRAEDA